jgi:hypothetical protein
MAQQYFPSQAAHTATRRDSQTPAFSDADEEFLKRITSAAEHDPNATSSEVTVLGGAQEVPLPESPAVPVVVTPPVKTKEEEKAEKKAKRKSTLLSFASTVKSALPFGKKDTKKDKDKVVSEPELQREEDELTKILDQLSLSTEQNKTFSLSAESSALLQRFIQILKDIVAGVPTAYHDLENLLTDSDQQIKGMFEKLPSFLQNLVKTIPAKITATMAPALAAASSEKTGADGQKMGIKQVIKGVPALKNLVKGDAVVAMLRTILNFLKLRFPALVTGTNALMGIAVFCKSCQNFLNVKANCIVLLFVFWYCHKRGREERVKKEGLAAGEAILGESGSELGEEDDHGLGASKRLEDSMRKTSTAAAVPLPETPQP